MDLKTDWVPDHVPPELVRECRLFDRTTIYENPYETLIPEIHNGPRVFYASNVFPGGTPGWVVRRAADLRLIYADTEFFHKRGNTQLANMIGESWDVIPTELDPPRHTEFRMALNPVFSPRNMAALDQRVRQRARFYIDRFKDRGSCEFVSEFAVPFPVTIFLDLLEFPQEEMDQFLTWEGHLLHGDDMDVRRSAVSEVKAYLVDAIARRRKQPGDDLISKAMMLEVDGRKWNDTEILGHCFNLYIGGLDTVTSNMGLHFRHLAQTPADQTSMRENPKSMVVATEELLRAFPAVTSMRICTKPYTIGGATFMPGDYVAMSTVLAGRDPEDFDSPNEVRLDRKPTHLTLGFGPHRCLGQHLARRELQIAMEEFLSAIPDFRIPDGFEVPFYVGNIIHVEKLPLVW